MDPGFLPNSDKEWEKDIVKICKGYLDDNFKEEYQFDFQKGNADFHKILTTGDWLDN